jgi:hypothetical protein
MMPMAMESLISKGSCGVIRDDCAKTHSLNVIIEA